MGIVKGDEIRGVYLDDGQVLCHDCMEAYDNYEETDFVLDDHIDKTDDLYFCDSCKEKL